MLDIIGAHERVVPKLLVEEGIVLLAHNYVCALHRQDGWSEIPSLLKSSYITNGFLGLHLHYRNHRTLKLAAPSTRCFLGWAENLIPLGRGFDGSPLLRPDNANRSPRHCSIGLVICLF